MLCAPLDWQYAEFPSSANDAFLCLYVRCGTSNKIKNPFCNIQIKHYTFMDAQVCILNIFLDKDVIIQIYSLA